MGQGTYTALAQLVAEELDCDWANVERRVRLAQRAHPAQSHLGLDVHRRQPGRALVAGLCAQGGRERARDAGRGRGGAVEGARRANARRRSGVITHAADAAASFATAQVAAAAAKLAPPKDVDAARSRGLEDRRQAAAPSRHSRQGAGQAGVRRRRERCPECCTRRSRNARCSAARWRASTTRAALGMRGVKKVVREEDFVAVVADSWWRANEALKKLKIEWDAAGNGEADNETIAAMLREGLADAEPAAGAQAWATRRPRFAAAAKVVEAEYQSPYLNHATHGAADVHGVVQAGGLPRSVDVDAERRGVDGRRGGDRRPAARQGRGAQDDAGRRFRPPRRPAGLRQAGRGDRQGDARRAGEDDVVARRGHAARLLSSGEHGAHEGGSRCAGQGDRHAHDDRLSVDPQGADAEGDRQGRHRLLGGALVQRHALHGGEPAGGLRDAQRPCAGRLLARAGPAERLLPRVLHRRACARRGQGPGRISTGDAEGGRQEPPRARSRGESRGLGFAAAGGRAPRRGCRRRLRQLCRDGGRSVGERCRASRRCTASSSRSIRVTS